MQVKHHLLFNFCQNLKYHNNTAARMHSNLKFNLHSPFSVQKMFYCSDSGSRSKIFIFRSSILQYVIKVYQNMRKFSGQNMIVLRFSDRVSFKPCVGGDYNIYGLGMYILQVYGINPKHEYEREQNFISKNYSCAYAALKLT